MMVCEVAAGPISEALFNRAKRVLPGGVSSPVRAFGAVGGTPIAIHNGQGAVLTDGDGRNYIDFVSSWGPLILGHAHPAVVKAVSEQLSRGTTYGAPHDAEVELAERIVDWYPGAEQVRFVSSGTEAVMSAIRLARGVTGRDIIVKFAGCYHGHADHLLVNAGSGLATLGTPSSAGVPDAFASLTRVLDLDDEDGLAHAFTEYGDHIAAVIIEPVPANNGLLAQRPEFLKSLRKQTSAHGALLIFDEVISGFRLARGGAAEVYGITPDIAVFGKVIGGGFPVGAFAARREHMRFLSPEGSVYQAGTLSGNPVAMSAGLATLRVLEQEGAWERLELLGQYLDTQLSAVKTDSDYNFVYQRIGSLFWICLQEGAPLRCPNAIQPESAKRYKTLFHSLLKRSLYLAPSAYEVGFLSLAHSRDDINALVNGIRDSLSLSFTTAE